MSNIYWIGPRQSDINDIECLFKGSITIYGDNTKGNIAYCNSINRINHNLNNEHCNNFIFKQLKKILKKDTNASFLFYNQEHAYHYGDDITKRSLGINNQYLLESLSNKAKCRYLFSNIVDIIPYVTLKGNECVYNNLHSFFPNEEYVIQKTISSGGDGTYHIVHNFADIEKEICKSENVSYILSPYLKDAISLNVHAIISENKIFLLPGSIQIIYEIENKLLYSGADFICFQNLSIDKKEQVNDAAFKICSILKDRGYRGILGIDFILQNDKLYFMELNPRFQASTQLINKALKLNNHKSLQELHLLAFENKISEENLDVIVKYSNIAYTTSNISLSRLKKVISSPEILCVQSDGYLFNEQKYVDKNVYLCRFIFNKNICFITNNKLFIQPNIFVEHIKSYLITDIYNIKRNIKFALLNHGVTLTKKALKLAEQKGNIKKAVFDAIDITIFENLKVNVPFSCNLNTLSPFTIEIIENEFVLLLDEYEISKVTIEFIPENLIHKKTSKGIPFETIINLATDRIRINPAPICIYKKKNIACKFCNLSMQNSNYDFKDIKETVNYCLENVSFRHFLIGGGTYSLNGGWDLIIRITKYIRSKCSKDIYLMSIPPKDISILEQLKNAGITEVAFNLELFDRQLASRIMPGKGKIPINQYMECFRESVKIWGNSGKVRSLLIYGLDTDDIFLEGIEKLCMIGVEPIISIFRPLKGTDFENHCPPSTSDIFSIYEKCQKIAARYSLCLGPDCPECQNNTLSFTDV